MSGHRSGGKFTGSHTTLIDATEKIVDRASELPEVTKIVLGIIKQIGNGKRNVKFTDIPAGLKLNIRGNTTIQEVFIYSSNPIKTKKELQKNF